MVINATTNPAVHGRELNYQPVDYKSYALQSTPSDRVMSRVRTILVLGYWVLGNIHRYWIVLLLGDIFWLF